MARGTYADPAASRFWRNADVRLTWAERLLLTKTEAMKVCYLLRWQRNKERFLALCVATFS
jgi:hypothetical protein